MLHAARRPWSWLIFDVRQKMRRVYSFAHGSVHFDLGADWGNACDDNAISFSSPSRAAALTITVHDEPRLSSEEIDRLSAEEKPFGTPRTEKKVLSVPNGSGFAQEFERRDEDRISIWLAHFLFFDHATVIASVNCSFEEMRDRRIDFEQILSSIAVSSPR
jgi:hypothetical protein